MTAADSSAVFRATREHHSPALQRSADLLLSALGLVLTSPLLIALLIIGFFETGRPLLVQNRVGRNRKEFRLVKLRTMRPDAPVLATHLVDPRFVTRSGRVLRKLKLDELPQLLNVLCGDMSLVGPRPCLPSQEELIEARAALGVFDVRPGVTGLAQISGVDMSTPRELAAVDAEMIASFSLIKYFQYIVTTLFGAGAGDRLRGG